MWVNAVSVVYCYVRVSLWWSTSMATTILWSRRLAGSAEPTSVRAPLTAAVGPDKYTVLAAARQQTEFSFQCLPLVGWREYTATSGVSMALVPGSSIATHCDTPEHKTHCSRTILLAGAISTATSAVKNDFDREQCGASIVLDVMYECSIHTNIGLLQQLAVNSQLRCSTAGGRRSCYSSAAAVLRRTRPRVSLVRPAAERRIEAVQSRRPRGRSRATVVE